MASALFGSTAIGYGDLFDRKVDDKTELSYMVYMYRNVLKIFKLFTITKRKVHERLIKNNFIECHWSVLKVLELC